MNHEKKFKKEYDREENKELRKAICDHISFSWGPVLNVTESLNDGLITISTTGVEDSQSLTLNLENINYTYINARRSW